MPKRKPMSEEKKQALREKMQVRWAERKQAAALKESSKKASVVTEALKSAESLRDEMRIVRDENPNMIEAKQAVDALDEVIARLGQVEGLVAAKG